jgi:PAS domain S-box-containing protein
MEKQGVFRQISLRLKSLRVPILILLLGILLISVLFWEARKGALEQLHKQFVMDAAMRASVITDALEEHLIDLEGLCNFYNASTAVTGKAFAAFVAPILKTRPGIQAFEWSPRVAYAELARFEAEARRSVLKDYRVYQLDAQGQKVPAAPRQYYYPVDYIEPLAGNEPALGFDLGSNPARLSALEQAAGTGQAVATERLTLVQETGTQAGFLIAIPVYRPEMPLRTVEQRRLALRGFVLGVFRAGDFIDAVLRPAPEKDLLTELVDQYGALDERLLYRFARPQLPAPGASWRTWLAPAAALRYEHPFTFASRQWLVNISASPAYVQDHISLFYWLIPPLGVLLSLLLALYFWTLLSHKERAEALAIERTASLTETTNMLRLIIEAIPVRVFWKDADLRYLGCNTLFAHDAGCNNPRELLGQDDFAMGWKDQAELYRADDRQVMESRRPKLNIAEPQTTPTGAKIWLNTSKVPLQKPNGEVFGVLGVYEDVTERKQAEEAFQVLVNQAPMGIFIVQKGKFQLINPGFEQISGYAAGELLGCESMRLVDPDYRQAVREHAIKMLRGEIVQACEFPILTKGGETRWVMEKVTSTLYQGERAALG